MQGMTRFLLLFCLPGLFLLFSSGAMAYPEPDPGQNTSLWRAKTIAAYQQANDDLPALPSHPQAGKISDAEQLLNLYQKEPQGRLSAIACAYWGAIRLADPDPWIKRMLQAGYYPECHERKMGEEAVESLPEALRYIYQVRKTPAALEALINLHLDGCPAETRLEVCQSLFLKYPDAFAHILSQKPISSYGEDLRRSSGFTFTSDLSGLLADDRSVRQRFTSLRDQAQKRPAPVDAFLTKYLTLVLNDARKQKAFRHPPRS